MASAQLLVSIYFTQDCAVYFSLPNAIFIYLSKCTFQHLVKIHWQETSVSFIHSCRVSVKYTTRISVAQGLCKDAGFIYSFTEGLQGALYQWMISLKDVREQRTLATGTISVWHWCVPSRKFGAWLSSDSFELLDQSAIILSDSELILSMIQVTQPVSM